MNMWARAIASLALLVLPGYASTLGAQEGLAANPIRKVVTLLEKMGEKIEKEAEREEALNEKFECYCKKTIAQLEDAIANAEAIGNIKPEDVQAKEAELASLKDQVEALKQDRKDDEATLKDAAARRQKENEEFLAATKEQKDTEDAAESALKALGAEELDKEATPSLLQESKGSASFLPRLLKAFERSTKVTASEKQEMGALIQGEAGAPSTGEAVAFIKDIEDEAEQAIAEAKTAETKEVENYEGLKKSKRQSITTVLEQLERKQKKIGELQVEIVNMKHMMKDGAGAMEENKKMLVEVKKEQAKRAAEKEEREQIRSQEKLALADTIKMLNDDDALDLFKKAMPSPSLLQITSGSARARKEAKSMLDVLRTSSDHRPELNFISLALSGKKVDFSKVFKKIDEMVKLLKQEQKDDVSKKEYCNKEFDLAEDKTKDLSKKIEELSASVAEQKESAARLIEEIKTMNEGVKSLDESVAQAGENRKAEAADYQELMQQDSAAIQLLGMAKERLNQFYNPDLTTNRPTTEKPYDPYALVQISAHLNQPEAAESPIKEVEVGTPPPAAGGYKTKGQESNGVISMISTMVGDLEKEMLVAKTEEENSQQEYEETVADAARKRDADLKAVARKVKAKSDLELNMNEDTSEKEGTSKELMAAKKYTLNLHEECDWLLSNFDLREKARGQETENLQRAKAVLSGADFSLLQVSTVRRLRGQ